MYYRMYCRKYYRSIEHAMCGSVDWLNCSNRRTITINVIVFSEELNCQL